jgi:hypothetical protein
MKISECVDFLKAAEREHGDIEICVNTHGIPLEITDMVYIQERYNCQRHMDFIADDNISIETNKPF